MDQRPVSRGSSGTGGRRWSAGLAIALAGLVALGLAGCGGSVREAIGGGTSDSSTVAPSMAGSSGETAAYDQKVAGGAIAPPPAPGPGAASGAPAGRAQVESGADSALPAFDESRQIVRTGSADLEVDSVSDAFAAVRQIAASTGGSVASSSYTGTADAQRAELTLRIPGDRFDEAVTRLREIAVEVHSITTGSNDVTDEYTDVQATIANLRAVEAQYTTLLGRASSIGDVLQVQDRLNQVRLQIDRTEARRQTLESQVAMSTITVSLRPAAAEVASGSGPLAAARQAWEASLQTLSTIGTAALVAVVYSWWLIPLVAVAAAVLWRRIRRPVAGQSVEVQS